MVSRKAKIENKVKSLAHTKSLRSSSIFVFSLFQFSLLITCPPRLCSLIYKIGIIQSIYTVAVWHRWWLHAKHRAACSSVLACCLQKWWPLFFAQSSSIPKPHHSFIGVNTSQSILEPWKQSNPKVWCHHFLFSGTASLRWEETKSQVLGSKCIT